MPSNGVPFTTIYEDQLGGPVGETAVCPKCGEEHEVLYGMSVHRNEKTGEEVTRPSKVLGYVECGGKSLLVALEGRLIKFEGKE